MPGALLAGKYRLQAEIGRGAMGTVWRALNQNLGQWVAIKIISAEHAGSAELRDRFDTEARAAAKLNSRFVVSVYDSGLTDGGLPFIVMELLDGEGLEDRIARHGALPLSEVARVARHLTRALSKAHGQGIVHRDLKPANIFLTRSDAEEDGDDWTAKVLDFGIAKMDDFKERQTTQTGTVLGTPLFMAPEQVRGASTVDPRADLYSFGMVVFNMLTGTFAFEGQSFGDLLVSICVDPLPDIRKTCPHLSAEVNAWFHKACARDPNQRFQNAEEMLHALQAVLGHQGAPGSLTHFGTANSSPAHAPALPSQPHQSGTGWPIPKSESSPHLESAAASSVTVFDAPRRSRSLLLGGAVMIGLFAVGAIGALRYGLPISDSATAQQPNILQIPDPVDEGTDNSALDEPTATGSEAPIAAPTASTPMQRSIKPEGRHSNVRPIGAKKPVPGQSAVEVFELDALPEEVPERQVVKTNGARPSPKATPKKTKPGTPDLGF